MRISSYINKGASANGVLGVYFSNMYSCGLIIEKGKSKKVSAETPLLTNIITPHLRKS